MKRTMAFFLFFLQQGKYTSWFVERSLYFLQALVGGQCVEIYYYVMRLNDVFKKKKTNTIMSAYYPHHNNGVYHI